MGYISVPLLPVATTLSFVTLYDIAFLGGSFKEPPREAMSYNVY